AKRLAEVSGSIDPAALDQAAADLAAVLATVRSGKGSLGGLIMDPTLYEELKLFVSKVRRNRILRALARYSIRHGKLSR
ncbi:MAG: hypothetical protein V2A73_11755, partial [Pseudomonadota bacterium]